LTNAEGITSAPLKYSSNAFTHKTHALTTFQFVTDMRWFRSHAEAPRLLRLSPLRADEDVNETSYHFRARSRCRGKSRPKWRRDHLVEGVKYARRDTWQPRWSSRWSSVYSPHSPPSPRESA